ncbi:MoaD/ThiS family protein [Chloroflexota bacterium]
MSIKVNTGPLLSQSTNKQQIVEVNGNTVGECLRNLVEQFPRLKLFEKDGQLLAYIEIYINGESAYPQELDKPVKDGDELSIILMIDGG